MATLVGQLTVDLVTNTASFKFDDAQLKAKKGAKDIQGSFNSMDFSEGRAGIALIGEDIGVRLPRHLQTFIAKLPGVASALSAAFPIIAVVTLINFISEAINKSEEHKKKLEEQRGAALAAASGISKHASQLEIDNLKIEDQIRVLEKKPAQNGTKIAAAEAKKSVDELIDSFVKAIEKQKELFQSQVQGTISKFLGGEGEVSQTADHIVQGISLIQKAKSDYERLNNLLNKNSTQADKDAAQHALDTLNERREGLKNFVGDAIADMEKLSHEADKQVTPPKYGKAAGVETPSTISMGEERQQAAEFKETLQALYGTFIQSDRDAAAQQQNGTLKNLKDQIEGAKKVSDEKIKQANAEWEGEKALLKATTDETIAIYENQKEQGIINEGQLAAYKQAALDKQYQAEVAHYEKLKTLLQGRPAARKKVTQEEEALEAAHNTEIISGFNKVLEERKKGLDELEKLATEFYNKENNEDNKNANLAIKNIEAKNKAWLADMALIQGGGEKKIAQIDKEIAHLQSLISTYHLYGQSAQNVYSAIHVLEQQRLKDLAQEMSQSSNFATAFKGQMLQMAMEGQDAGQKIAATFKQAFDQMNTELANFIVTGQANWRQLAQTAITEIVKIGLQWVESKIMMAIFGQATEKSTGASSIATNAAVAGSAGVASFAAAPWPIDMGAPAFGAAMFGTAMSYMAALSAAGGALLPNAEALVHTHPKEMILPQPISTFILNTMASARGESPGRNVEVNYTHAPTYNGAPISPEEMLEHSAYSRTQLKRMFNRFN